ncbi:MAG: hypothetical protein KIG92_02195 [Prevotella sp.]|uniref:hypothetical protein n=1 Tax=Hallella sp. TaxID=2980186 RepID=UPI002A920D6A|nr:hypothetical protein [Hallella sp.]MBS7399090.1 hypothetical protein [Prevotella sp.]MDY5924262.1 hypothetical protein [Hallella sp.]
MANKQKTRVVLPGGIQGLVHTLQNGTAEPAMKAQVDVTKLNDENDDNSYTSENENNEVAAEQPVQQAPQAQTVQQAPQAQTQQAAPAQPTQQAPQAQVQQAAPAQPERAPRGRRPKENTMKEYTIVKDDSRDSWDLFLDMAKQYKDGGGKLATIYIDESLKNVLDRMKYCGPEKLSTSAILSSIVARFIFDHEEDIKKVMFSGRLI